MSSGFVHVVCKVCVWREDPVNDEEERRTQCCLYGGEEEWVEVSRKKK